MDKHRVLNANEYRYRTYENEDFRGVKEVVHSKFYYDTHSADEASG